VRISCEFLISDCRGDSELGLCSSWHLANRMLQHSGRICFQQANRRDSEPIRALLSGIILARCHELHRHQAFSPLQIDIRNLCHIHTEWFFSRPQRLLSRLLKARCADRDHNWNWVKKWFIRDWIQTKRMKMSRYPSRPPGYLLSFLSGFVRD